MMENYIDFFAENTDYGSSRTRSFADIFPTFESFQNAWNNTTFSKQAVALTQGIPELGASSTGTTNLKLIWELLISEYANSTIATSDESRFTLQCMGLVFQYAPAWIKRLEIQHALHEMDINSEDFLRGSIQLHNMSLNPSEDPATDTLTALSTINQQNATVQKRDKFKALAILEELLKTNVTAQFLDRFKPLFRYFVSAQRPLLYKTKGDN